MRSLASSSNTTRRIGWIEDYITKVESHRPDLRSSSMSFGTMPTMKASTVHRPATYCAAHPRCTAAAFKA